MIQLNLLPDIKLEYIKAQHARRLVTTIAVLVTVAAITLLAVLLGANGLQNKHIDDLSRDIDSSSRKLQNQPQIGRILTVQNQLQSLTQLHSEKPAASRLFDYLNQLTPVNVAISNLTVDFTAQTFTITGSADALSNVNKYVDTLKFTTYSVNTTKEKAFDNVVLSTFGLAADAKDNKPASYTITLAYNKAIFDITQDIKLNVPSQVTTRSELEKPADLFQAAPAGSARGSN
jgi:Tfp pilus assembly protein PilN